MTAGPAPYGLPYRASRSPRLWWPPLQWGFGMERNAVIAAHRHGNAGRDQLLDLASSALLAVAA